MVLFVGNMEWKQKANNTKGKLLFIYKLAFISIGLTTISIVNDDIVQSKVIAEIWQHHCNKVRGGKKQSDDQTGCKQIFRLDKANKNISER